LIDFTEWSVLDVDSGSTEMDVIAKTVANASTSAQGEGTTTWCTSAGVDGAYAPVAAVRGTSVFTTIAGGGIETQDSGSLVVTWGSFGAATVACGSAGACTPATVAAAINALTGVSGVTCAASGTANITTTCQAAAGSGLIGDGTAVSWVSTAADSGGDNATEASDTWTAGVDGITTMFVEDNPEDDSLIVNIITTGDFGTDGAVVAESVYTKFSYDSGDAFNLGSDGEIAVVVPGASLAQFETEMASLTNEAGAAPTSISYRTGALTSGVSAFQIGT
jgi:hypothetical protein